MKKFKAFYAFMLAFFSADSLVEDGKINLSDEQKQKLQDALGEKTKLSEVVDAMNQELAEAAKAENGEDQELVDLKAEAMKQLIAQGLAQEDAEAIVESPKANNDESIKKSLKALTEHMNSHDKMIKQLLAEPEEDAPLAKGEVKNLKDMHTKTHF